MGTTPEKLYLRMLGRDADIESEIQKLAYAYAEKESNVSIFLALLKVRNLLPELDAEISKRTEADVLVSWSSRNGRTTDELLNRFNNEKRVTLLAQLGSREGLPVELYKTFAKMGKPTLSQTIIENKSAPIEAKKIAAKTAIAGYKTNSNTLYKVQAMFKDIPSEVADSAIDSVTSIAALAGLISIISPEKQVELAKRAKYILIDLKSEYVSDYYTSSAIKQIFSAVKTIEGKREIREALKLLDENNGLKWSSDLKALISAPDIDPIDTALDVISNGSSDEIDNSIAYIERSGNRIQLREAIRRALQAENTKIDTIIRFADKVDYSDRRSVIERIKSDKVKTAKIMANIYDDTNLYNSTLVGGSGLVDSFLGTDYSARDLIIEMLKSRTTGNMLRSSFAKHVIDLFIEQGDINLVLEALPTSVAKLIVSEFKDSPEEWTIFESLLPEWQGSVAELIRCAKSIN